MRAEKLRDKWTRADRGVALDFIDCPDRRLIKAATDLAEREVEDAGTHVTVILPRRSYSALLGRLLHDRTADKIAAAVSRIPRSAATIVPYDVPSRVAVLQARQAARATAANAAAKAAKTAAKGQPPGAAGGWPQPVVVAPSARATPAAEQAASAAELAREGDVAAAHSLFKQAGRGRPRPASPPSAPSPAARSRWRARSGWWRSARSSATRCSRWRSTTPTGNLTAMFYGRSHIPGLICGARVRLSGSVGLKGGQPVMINPAYELVSLSEE